MDEDEAAAEEEDEIDKEEEEEERERSESSSEDESDEEEKEDAEEEREEEEEEKGESGLSDTCSDKVARKGRRSNFGERSKVENEGTGFNSGNDESETLFEWVRETKRSNKCNDTESRE